MSPPKYDPTLLDHRSSLAPLSRVLAPPYDLLANPSKLGYLELTVKMRLDETPETAARVAAAKQEWLRRRSFAAAGTCGD